MYVIVLLCAMMSQGGNKHCDIGNIYEYVNFTEVAYTDSLKKEMDKLYKSISTIDLDEYTDDQKCDLIFFMGMYHSRKIDKQVDRILKSNTRNNELMGMCFYYKYQSGSKIYLGKYLEYLEKQRIAIGDTRLIPPLAFLKDRNVALDYLNRHILNADAVEAELMLETLRVIKVIAKNDNIFDKYPNLRKIK